MIDEDLAVVFYDLTTIRAEGSSTPTGDVRQFGMAKEGVIARQFMLGVVQTAEGLPIYHQVVDGNTAETTTLLPTLSTVLALFPTVRRVNPGGRSRLAQSGQLGSLASRAVGQRAGAGIYPRCTGTTLHRVC